MRNEKLVPTTLPDPREREPYLPKPNGDNKLTAAMVPYYTGKCIQVQYHFFTYLIFQISLTRERVSLNAFAFFIIEPLCLPNCIFKGN